MFRSWQPIAVLSGILAAVLAAGCSLERPVPPATEIRQAPAGELTIEQTQMGHRMVANPPAAAAITAEWYASVKSPRILVLLNRRFAGDAELWRAETRLVLQARHGESKPGERGPAAKTTTADRIQAGKERRTDLPQDVLPAGTAANVRQSLLAPFLAAGCHIVDADTAERIAQSAASASEGPESAREPFDVSTEVFQKDADWIIEVLALPSDVPSSPWMLAGKVVDLRSKRVLAYATTRELLSAPQALPGAEQPAATEFPLEEQARWLAGCLAARIPK